MSVQIINADVREALAGLPDESVHCIVTSPPYWGLRDYGVAGQLGLEPTLGEHIETMVAVFREARRVLRKDGTCWLNYGDSYAGGGYSNHKNTGGASRDQGGKQKHSNSRAALVKPKDLCMVPNRLAIALQDDGWWVRSEIIWHKPNPMPESTRDRPTSSHEKVWLLTKSGRYWYDADAVRTPAADSSVARWAQDVDSQEGSHRANAGGKTNGTMKAVGGPRKTDKQRGHSRRHAGFNDRWDAMPKAEQQAMGANLRNVWTINTAAYSGAHFATFPPEMAERCIKAGCPIAGTVLDPFGGSGTTGLVADRLGRSAILIELNPEYAEMARCRIEADGHLFATVAVTVPASHPFGTADD